MGGCLSSQGTAQTLDLGALGGLNEGRLVPLLEDWAGERYPLCAYRPNRRHVSAEVRAFLNLVSERIEGTAAWRIRPLTPR